MALNSQVILRNHHKLGIRIQNRCLVMQLRVIKFMLTLHILRAGSRIKLLLIFKTIQLSCFLSFKCCGCLREKYPSLSLNALFFLSGILYQTMYIPYINVFVINNQCYFRSRNPVPHWSDWFLNLISALYVKHLKGNEVWFKIKTNSNILIDEISEKKKKMLDWLE